MRRSIAVIALGLIATQFARAHAVATPTRVATPPDSASAHNTAQSKVAAFLVEWRKAWYISDSTRMGARFYDRTLKIRNAHAHCHGTYKPEQKEFRLQSNYSPIYSAVDGQPKCPSWILGPIGSTADESDNIDGPLLPALQSQTGDSRAWLIAALDSLQSVAPTDGWIFGQRIRFLIDAGHAPQAVAAATRCTFDAPSCHALLGYALFRAHSFQAADSAFGVMFAELPVDKRCEWSSIRALLPHASKEDIATYDAYNAKPCADRVQIDTRYWWLADPLYSVGGNERRAAHFARHVLLQLHSSLDMDERNHWPADLGGDAVAEMLTRYGWPSVAVRMGGDEDKDHDDNLKGRRLKPASPYTTAEYTSNRFHFGADWRAVENPLASDESAWQLYAPVGMRTDDPGTGDVWWPVEHSTFSLGGIAQLPEGQFAAFPRQSAIQLVDVVDIDRTSASASVGASPAVASMLSRPASIALVVSDKPEHVEIVAKQGGFETHRIVLNGTTTSRPVIVGVEAIADSAAGGAVRTRFGATLPAALSDLARGTIAMSQPVFFRPSANGYLPLNVDSLLACMLGSTSIARGEKVGVYWENYGIPVGDSVRVSVSVTPETGPGFLRRLGTALRIIDATSSGVAVAWQDPKRGGAQTSNEVPIVPHSFILDVSDLTKGSYQIEVTITTPSRDPIRAHRSLTVE